MKALPVYQAQLVTDFERLAPAYEKFKGVALTDYAWPMEPLPFSSMQELLQKKVLLAFAVFQHQHPVAFCFFQAEPHGALEIKLLFIDLEAVSAKVAIDALFPALYAYVLTLPNWQVLSFPMTGERCKEFVNYLTWYKLKPVAQASMRFSYFEGTNLLVHNSIKQKLDPLPEGYQILPWHLQYHTQCIEVLFEAFQDSVDSLWDPRFKTREGVESLLDFLREGSYGVFWPASNSVLLNAENKVVGVCLFSIFNAQEANVPLIGLHKEERHKGLGKQLLSRTLQSCLDEMLAGQFYVQYVSATVATGNTAAVRMYRTLGFQEHHWYPHLFLERSVIETFQKGKWC
jgi:ribosomal protein S18 acetylase RimI-like enzyme